MQVPFVLSSGQFLLTLEVAPTCTVAHLKQQLQSVLTSQVHSYMHAQGDKDAEPAAFCLRATPNESPHTTFTYVNSRIARLFAYRGEQLGEGQKVTEVPLPICVLRPSDIVTTRCSLSGKKDTVLFNTQEEVTWREADSSAMELVIVQAKIAPFLCCADATETISSLISRLQRFLCSPSKDLQLWYQSCMLSPHLTVHFYGLSHRSRVVLQIAGESIALAIDVHGKRAAFPIDSSEKTADLVQKVKILLEEWKQIENLHPYVCLCAPISPYSQQYQVPLPDNRMLSLQFSDGRVEKVLIPAICTVKEVKRCIEMQHGLPTSNFALTFLCELSFEATFKDLGVESGDNLVIIKKKVAITDWTTADIYSRYRRKRLCLPSNTTIFQLKQSLQTLKQDSSLFLLKGTEVLPDNASLAQCGIDENVPIYCGNAEETRKRLAVLTRSCFIPPRLHTDGYTEAGESMELFERGQAPGRLKKEERVGRYERERLEVVDLRVISPSVVLSLNIHSKATIQMIKTHLQRRLKIPSFRLLYGDEELEGNRTLEESQVPAGSDLVLMPPGAIQVAVRTAAGLRFPVALQPATTMHYLCPVLEKLTGLQFTHHRVLNMKVVPERGTVPAAVDALTAVVQCIG